MRHLAILGTACVLTVGALGTFVARAADLGPTYPAPPVYAEPDPQFEFGTGWYLRGDASFGPEDHPVVSPLGIVEKQDWNYVLGGGIGYKFNDFLRVDATGDYFEPNKLKTVSNGIDYKASLDKYDGLANLYIDLGNWYGLTPYVGGGAGFAVFNPSESRSVAAVFRSDNTASKTNFAWAAMAGVSYQFDHNVAVDLGYRHLDLGHFATTLVGYAIDHHYTEDQVRIGLRYSIF